MPKFRPLLTYDKRQRLKWQPFSALSWPCLSNPKNFKSLFSDLSLNVLLQLHQGLRFVDINSFFQVSPQGKTLNCQASGIGHCRNSIFCLQRIVVGIALVFLQYDPHLAGTICEVYFEQHLCYSELTTPDFHVEKIEREGLRQQRHVATEREHH